MLPSAWMPTESAGAQSKGLGPSDGHQPGSRKGALVNTSQSVAIQPSGRKSVRTTTVMIPMSTTQMTTE